MRSSPFLCYIPESLGELGMLIRVLIGAAIATTAFVASAQTSTTNCYSMGRSVQCTTTTPPPPPTIDWNAYNQQNQQNMNQAFQNLGAAIAANRERSRQRKAAEAAQAQAAAAQAQAEAEQTALQARKDAVLNAVQAALDRDTAPTPPPPAEKPVLLSCVVEDFSTNLALYEKSGRVDVTEAGVTKARAASFTPDAVTWQGPVWRSAVSRIDMKMVSVSVLPEAPGAQVTAACSLAERKF